MSEQTANDAAEQRTNSDRQADSNAASHGTHSTQDTASSPAQPSTQDQPINQPKETGHVPGVSPVVRDGPASPKATPMSFLKPVVQRTYDDSADTAIAPKGGRIIGLRDIPKSWKKIPQNASVSHEVSWVQANRLAVTKELPSGGVKVDLTKAYAPAPSMSALSWLETSIRSYAKFIEVASKQASSGQDEAEFVRKERMQIAEIDALLAEMYDAEG